MLLRLTVLLFTSLLSLTAKANLITYDFVGSIDSYTNYALSDYPDLQGETLSFSVTFLDEDVTGNHEYGLDAISDHQIGEYLFQTPNEGTAIGSYNGRVWMYILPFTTTFVYKDGVKVDTLKLDGGIGFNDDGTNGYWNYNLFCLYHKRHTETKTSFRNKNGLYK